MKGGFGAEERRKLGSFREPEQSLNGVCLMEKAIFMVPRVLLFGTEPTWLILLCWVIPQTVPHSLRISWFKATGSHSSCLDSVEGSRLGGAFLPDLGSGIYKLPFNGNLLGEDHYNSIQTDLPFKSSHDPFFFNMCF